MPNQESSLSERYPVEIGKRGDGYKLSVRVGGVDPETEGSLLFTKSITKEELSNASILSDIISKEMTNYLAGEEIKEIIEYLVGAVLQALTIPE